MMLKLDSPLAKFAKNLGLKHQSSPSFSMPREYLSLEGYRITEEPRKRLNVLFLGSLEAWGEPDLKLAPKLSLMFHEADHIVLGVNSPILKKVSVGKKKRFISRKNFQGFCEQVIPEKMSFVIDPGFEPHAMGETVAALVESGARVAFSKTMLRLEQGLFLRSEGSVCEVKAQRDLAKMRICGEKRDIKIKEKMLLADGLGNFISGSSLASGIIANVDFAQYEDWAIERVRWCPLSQEASQGTRLISC